MKRHDPALAAKLYARPDKDPATNITSLDDKRPKPAPPVPQRWMERFSNPEPLSQKEKDLFTHEAGPHVNAWIMDIFEAGEGLVSEARLLKTESGVHSHGSG